MQSYENYEIIFVDNNSKDGSVEFIKENYNNSKIKIYETGKNLGFAGGNNFGYKYCSGEFIVLLNNDTVVEKVWLKNLLECISSDATIGLAQSLVLTEGIPMRYYKKNGTINLLGHNIMEIFKIDNDGTGEIFLASGCSLIIRKSLVDLTGGLFFDEYFAYSEDTFLSFKIKFRGLKILHTSKSVVHHKGSGTAKKEKKSLLYYYQERNRLLNFFLFFSAGFLIKYIPYLVFNFFLKLFASLVSKKYSAAQVAKAYWWLVSNQKWIAEKRTYLDSIKTVREEDVIKYLSGKIFNGNNFFEKLINRISIAYCKIAGINVIELHKIS